MDADEFRQRGKDMVDFIVDYLTNIRNRPVFPNVKPGYMRPLIDDQAPRQSESWDNIFNDIEKVIMPGVCIMKFLFTICNFVEHIDHALAISLYACLFSRTEFLSIFTWGRIYIVVDWLIQINII